MKKQGQKKVKKKIKRKVQKKAQVAAPVVPEGYVSQRSNLMRKFWLSFIVIVLVVLAAWAILYGIPLAGKAYIQAPPLEPLNLDANGSYEIDTSKVTMWDFRLTPAGSVGMNTYSTVIIMLDDGTISYEIKDKATNVVLAKGLLGSQRQITEGIYLNNDANADVELSYTTGYVKISNKNYVARDTSAIELWRLDGTSWNRVSERAAYVPLGLEARYRFKVSSSSAPTATLVFDDSTITKTFQEVTTEATSTSKTYELKFTPTSRKPYVATVSATVGGVGATAGQVTTKKFILGGEGVLYSLQQEGYPHMNLTIPASGDFSQAVFAVNFTSTSDLQPFSLPCSTLSPNLISSFSFDTTKVVGIYSYGRTQPTDLSPKVLSWVPGAGSYNDYTTFDPKKASVMKLTGSAELKLTAPNCALSSSDLPSLQEGWNFIGITGYETRTVNELVAPAAKTIAVVYELKRGENLAPATVLEPGKAYWVQVK